MIAAMTIGHWVLTSFAGAGLVVLVGFVVGAFCDNDDVELFEDARMAPRSLTSLNGAPFTITEQPPAETFTALSTAVKPPPVLNLVEDCGPVDIEERRRRRIADDISRARPFDAGQDAPEIGGAS